MNQFSSQTYLPIIPLPSNLPSFLFDHSRYLEFIHTQHLRMLLKLSTLDNIV